VEPYLLIVHLAFNAGDPAVPPPQSFVRPSQARCMRERDFIRSAGHRAECIPESRQVLTIAK
jgi:hypothetical protein